MTGAAALVGTLAPGDHVLLSYTNDHHQRDAIDVFVRDGVARSEKIFYFADRTGPDAFDRDLLASGQLVHTFLAEALVPFDVRRTIGTLRDAVAGALTEGYGGVRVSGEMTWTLRNGLGCDEACALERSVDEVTRSTPLTTMCQYDLRECAREHMATLRAVHPGVLENLLLRIDRSVTPPVLRLAGEADLSTFDALAGALADARAVAGRDGRDLVVDLAALEFADVRTLRLLTETERATLRSPRPFLGHVLELLGWSR